MKTFTSLLVGCSLALAGAAFAQQPEQSPSPGAKKPGAGNNRAAHAQPGGAPAQAGQPAQNPARSQGPGPGAKQHGPPNAGPMPQQPQQPPRGPHGNAGKAQGQTPTQSTPPAPNTGAANAGAPNPAAAAHKGGHKNQPNAQTGAPAGQGANAGGQPSPSASVGAAPTAAPQAQAHGKGRKGANPKANASATPAAAGAPSATPATAASASASPVTGTSSANAPKPTPAASSAAMQAPTAASAAPSAPTTSAPGATAALPTPKPNTAAATKKPAPQQVQQIKQQHASFRAQPRPQEAPPVTFNPGYRIQGAEQWQAPQYEVFRRYRPERHDEAYYRSRYSRVEEIGGGWYYWDNGYWYPAWGYRPSQEYYAYDGPIYVGHRAERPDQVIADVQAELKDMGYYKGEVDGLVGPLTRQALTEYQADSGLYQTAAIDEPTLDSLGLNS